MSSLPVLTQTIYLLRYLVPTITHTLHVIFVIPVQRRDEDLLVVQHGTSFDYLRELQLVVALLRRVYKEIAIFYI